MSLKHNIIANYISQIYVAIIGIIMFPIYIKYMGAEAYGLIGFFTMLQAWFGLLDLGLTPTISRETARFCAGNSSAVNFRRLFKSLHGIFYFTAIIGGGTLFFSSHTIANNWLNTQQLSSQEVELALQIMAACLALRWIGGLYRGVVTGSEKLVWLSGFNVIFSTLRFVVVLPIMWLLDFTPFVFFIYQFAVALIETICLWLKTTNLLPSVEEPVGWSIKPIRPILTFALSITFTSSVWVLVTQMDKLILSKILPLADYGYFTLAVLIASSITIISGPISNAIMPRMAHLHAEKKRNELLKIYRDSTQLVSIIAGAAAITLAFCADKLLIAWTGDMVLAAKAAPILKLYAIGNGFLAVAAFPYYLQYAKGNVRYHLIGNLILVALLIPSVIYAAINYGAIGAGYIWIAVNALYLLIWVGYTHGKIEPGLHTQWIVNDILVIYLAALIVAALLSIFSVEYISRSANLLYVLIFGFLLTVASGLASSLCRTYIKTHLQRN